MDDNGVQKVTGWERYEYLVAGSLVVSEDFGDDGRDLVMPGLDLALEGLGTTAYPV